MSPCRRFPDQGSGAPWPRSMFPQSCYALFSLKKRTATLTSRRRFSSSTGMEREPLLGTIGRSNWSDSVASMSIDIMGYARRTRDLTKKGGSARRSSGDIDGHAPLGFTSCQSKTFRHSTHHTVVYPANNVAIS